MKNFTSAIDISAMGNETPPIVEDTFGNFHGESNQEPQWSDFTTTTAFGIHVDDVGVIADNLSKLISEGNKLK